MFLYTGAVQSVGEFQRKYCDAILSSVSGWDSRTAVSVRPCGVSPTAGVDIFLLEGFLHRLLLSDNLCSLWRGMLWGALLARH